MDSRARNSPAARLFHPALVLLVIGFLALRAYALLGSWFRLDDVALLSRASHDSLNWAHLTSSYDGHLSPGGRLLTWLWFGWFGIDWTPWALTLLMLNALVAWGFVRLLITLFGREPLVIALVALGLASALWLPSSTWWAGASTTLPWLICLLFGLATWVSYLRRGGRLRLATSLAWGVLGLFFTERALAYPVLCLALALSWFVTGSLRSRVAALVRERRVAVVLMTALPLAYLLVVGVGPGIAVHVADTADLGPVTGTLVFRGLASGLLGGPFSWSDLPNGPIAHVSTLTAVLGVALFLGVLVHGVRTRTHALLGWLPLLLGTIGAILGVSLIGPLLLGSSTGLDVRYYPELPLLLVLGLGLGFLPVRGGATVQEIRAVGPHPLEHPAYVGWAAALVVGASVLSSFSYLSAWSDESRTQKWFEQLERSIRAAKPAPAPLVDTSIPAQIASSPGSDDDTLARLVPMLGLRAAFPHTAIDRLFVVDQKGRLQPAGVTSTRRAFPPSGGALCHAVHADTTSMVLDGPVLGFGWWVRLDYEARAETPVVIRAGETTHRLTLASGRHTLFYDAAGSFSSIQFSNADPSAGLCLGGLLLGQPTSASADAS